MEEARFKLPKIKRPRNPLTNEGWLALAIVLAVIILISAIVYFSRIRQSKARPAGGSPILPATTTEVQVIGEDARPTSTPAAVPEEELIPMLEETPTATPSPAATESVSRD